MRILETSCAKRGSIPSSHTIVLGIYLIALTPVGINPSYMQSTLPTPYLRYQQYPPPHKNNPTTYLSNSTASSAPTGNFAVYVPMVFDGMARFFDRFA